MRVAVLPSADALSELHNIGALLLPELIDVHKSAHGVFCCVVMEKFFLEFFFFGVFSRFLNFEK